MKESQTKRDPFVERARRQREIDQESAAQFNGLSAPARSTSARPQTSPEQPIEQDSAMGEAVASEEETEQEEDSVMQVPKSQEAPQSSTEEDKENFNEPLDAAAAASAHERLSQVLGYQPVESPSREHFDVENSDAIGHQGALASRSNGQMNGMVHSSHVMVKDSQPMKDFPPRLHRQLLLFESAGEDAKRWHGNRAGMGERSSPR
ncbi:hypothetical protein N7465_000241 [Penicillium sp. CMV-2018d]|nr:hypothetical protein N7465_000241 [Penicillium sp. CMV-2018d]